MNLVVYRNIIVTLLVLAVPVKVFGAPNQKPHPTNEVLYVKFKYPSSISATNMFAASLIAFSQLKLKTKVKYVAPIAMLQSKPEKGKKDVPDFYYITYFSRKHNVIGIAVYVSTLEGDKRVYMQKKYLDMFAKKPLTSLAQTILTVAVESFDIEEIKTPFTFGEGARFRFQ